jgi:hypothetical protein
MLNLPLTGEFGIRKVLFEEVAELGVRAVLVESWLALDAPGPKMEWGPPEGVEGWAIVRRP